MRKPRSLFASILFLAVLLLLTSCHKEGPEKVSPLDAAPEASALMHLINPDTELRGVWIASVYNIDFPSSPGLSADALRAELDSLLDTCEEVGLNTIFFQVRPSADALYRSDIFPVSRYLSADGSLPFDPLAYLVDAAHHRNLFLYAWINPLRVTVSETDVLPPDSPAAVFPEWTVNYGGKLYFNPGLPEVRQLVADGIEEIVTNYSVDGVVFDDYFYPYAVFDGNGREVEFDDGAAFRRYGDGLTLADWRRSNVNDLIRLCWYTVHAAVPECSFGVAPSGIWRNSDGKNGGSETRGYEAYVSGYCDALAWVREGTVDFLSPQIYWDFDTAATPFDVVTRWWNTQLEGSGVKLYVSHASYLYEDGEWENPRGQLTEQIAFARSEHSYRGSVCYGYDEIHGNVNGAADDLRSAYRDEIIYTDIVSNGLPVTVSSPPDGSVLYDSRTYILGLSDPYYPLYLNGEKVGRTKSGYFSLTLTLKSGENRFVFEQNGVETVYTLHLGDGHLKKNDSDAPEQSEPEEDAPVGLFLSDPYPTGKISTREGILWVTCTAPYGATVQAEIGGVVTELSPMEEPAESGKSSVRFGKNALLPEVGASELLDCGKVHFTAFLPDAPEKSVAIEGCSVRAMGENAVLCVRVTREGAPLKLTENSSVYNDYSAQPEGMTAYAVHQRNGFYLLGMGGYLSEEDAEELWAGTPLDPPAVESASVTDSGRTTELRLRCAVCPVLNGSFDEMGRFAVTLYGAGWDSSASPPDVRDNPLFRSCEVVPSANHLRFLLTLRAAENFYGYELSYEEGAAVVRFRNPIAIDPNADRPLSGTVIELDAGHGGWDSGASGPSPVLGEKELNLAVAKETASRLVELGAEVRLTRQTDETVDLSTRMDRLDEVQPDLCLSLHQNSMDYPVDITRVRGTLALWTTEAGVLPAECVGRAAASRLGRVFRGSQYQALAVCRNPKFPSALIELGFMTSVEEYELSASARGVRLAAEGVVEGILAYFRKTTEYARR